MIFYIITRVGQKLYYIFKENFMDNLKELLGKRIRELRKDKKLTQEQFAELIGIEPRNLIKIENSQTFPRVQTLEKILEVLDISPQVLFNFEHLEDVAKLRIKIIEKLEHNDDLVKLVYKMLF